MRQLLSFAYRQNGLYLDNAAIVLSGCLKNLIEALSKYIRQAARLDLITAHCQLLTAHSLSHPSSCGCWNACGFAVFGNGSSGNIDAYAG